MSPQVLSHDTDNIKPALVNRRSGVALAMRHRQQCTTNYGLTALGREMSYAPVEYGTLYLHLSMATTLVKSAGWHVTQAFFSQTDCC